MSFWIHFIPELKEIEAMAIDIAQLKKDLAAAQAAFKAMKTRVEQDTAAFKAQIQALKDQIGNGIVISQADLDALDASVTALASDLGAIDPDPSNPPSA